MAAVLHLEPRFDEPDAYERPAPRLRLVEAEPIRRPRPQPARSPHAHAVYRRRRVLAALVGLGLVLAVARVGAVLAGSFLATPQRLPHVQQVIVQPGDSLWTIAQRVAPGHDPRPIVDAIETQRGGAGVVAGETLTVPAP